MKKDKKEKTLEEIQEEVRLATKKVVDKDEKN